MTDRLASIGANTLAPRATLGPAGDGDALANINTRPLADGASCYVLASRALFRLNKTSVLPPDGTTIIAPIAGPGRWLIEVNSGTGGSQILNEAGVLFPFRPIIEAEGVYVNDTGTEIQLNPAQFDARNFATFEDAVTAASGATLVLAGSHTMAADQLDATVTLKFKSGGTLSVPDDYTIASPCDFSEGGTIVVAAGKTVTHTAAINASDTVQVWDVSASGSAVTINGDVMGHLTQENFGAVGDGTVFDDAPRDAMTATAIASHVPIELLARNYHYQTTWTLQFAQALMVSGAGASNGAAPRTTQLTFDGVDGTQLAVIDLINCRDCIVSNFDIFIVSNAPTQAGIRIQHDNALAAGGHASSHNTVRYVNLYEQSGAVCPVGVWIHYAAASFNNNEFHRLENVFTTDFAECGFRIGEETQIAPNAKNIVFDMCAVNGDGTTTVNGIENWGGSFNAYNCSGEFLSGSMWRIYPVGDPCVVVGGQCEECSRLALIAANNEGFSATSPPIKFIGWRYACLDTYLAPDGYAVLSKYQGPLSIDGCLFYGVGTTTMKIKHGIDGITYEGALEVVNCSFPNIGQLEAGLYDVSALTRVRANNNLVYDAIAQAVLFPEVPATVQILPEAIADLALDLDADVGITGAGPTLSWLDQSGSGNNATGAGTATGLVTARDLNFGGHFSVSFNGTDDYIEVPGAAAAVTANSPFYLVMVCRYITLQAALTEVACFSNTGTTTESYIKFNKNTVGAGHNVNFQRDNDAGTFDNKFGTIVGTTNPTIFEVIYDGTSLTVYENQLTEIATVALSGGAITIDQVFFGAQKLGGFGASLFTNVAFARILLYSSVPTVSERSLLVQTLRGTYLI